MVNFEAEIMRSETQGAAMVGWVYIDVPQPVAARIKADYKRAFRVRGQLDGHPFDGLTLMPKGKGDYFLAINGAMRKVLRKDVGDVLAVQLEEDKEFRITLPADLEICLSDGGDDLMERFMALAKSHRNYFINYVTAAKTDQTRAKRIALTVEAMSLGIGFGAMIRLDKARRLNE